MPAESELTGVIEVYECPTRPGLAEVPALLRTILVNKGRRFIPLPLLPVENLAVVLVLREGVRFLVYRECLYLPLAWVRARLPLLCPLTLRPEVEDFLGSLATCCLGIAKALIESPENIEIDPRTL